MTEVINLPFYRSLVILAIREIEVVGLGGIFGG